MQLVHDTFLSKGLISLNQAKLSSKDKLRMFEACTKAMEEVRQTVKEARYATEKIKKATEEEAS